MLTLGERHFAAVARTNRYRLAMNNARPPLLVVSAVLILLAVLFGPASAQNAARPQTVAPPTAWPDLAPPALTVVISVDQLRGDYLYRFRDLFLPATDGDTLGGFAYLMERGAYFANARYEHYPLFTGPGHAVILTGAHPYKSGIVGNDWWDNENRRPMYCVDDERYEVVGAADGSKASPMGPANLKATTVGDELKLATAGRARVVTLAIKDRAAILLGGHAQDISLWFDTTGGRWISSTAYCRDGKLPAWVEELNSEEIPAQALGKDWTTTLSESTLSGRSMVAGHLKGDVPEGFGYEFPHHIGAEASKANFKAFCMIPAANEFAFTTAERAIAAEKLGQRDTPDLLAINLSPNDYIGHAFGPYSPEVLEMTVATDRALSKFINYLDKTIPGGMDNVAFVLTADHGVSPIPEDVVGQPFNLSAGRFRVADLVSTVADALTRRYGRPTGGSWFATTPDNADGSDPNKSGAFIDGAVYLNPEAVRVVVESRKAGSRMELEMFAADTVNAAGLPGVYACYSRAQILQGAVSDTDMNRHLANGVHPRLSGDLIVIPEPFNLEDPAAGDHATTHGTPYTYDTHVPVIMCYPKLIQSGVYFGKASPADIAPTLSLILGVEFPSGCDGRPLSEALPQPGGR